MTTKYDTRAPGADWTTRWAHAPLNARAWPASAPGRDAALKLLDRLVALGGWAACMRDPSLWERLLRDGSDVPGEGAEMVAGRPSDCHENSLRLQEADPSLARHYGYALSEDGMWREHSWCVRPDGRIVETTVARVAYFGCPDPD